MARNLLANVPEEKIFWSHDGQIFRNLKELAQGLNNMNDETYMYHVNGNRNDFTNWIRDVVGDQEMANDLEKTLTRSDASKKVTARVNYLSSIK